jgi:hypothetical protein
MSTMSTSGFVRANSVSRVEMSLPADATMLFLARMAAAAVATRVDLNYEQVEDLRLAVDELCIELLSSGVRAGQIALVFQWDDGGTLEVVASLILDGGPSAQQDVGTQPGPLSFELSQRILEALVDEHGADDLGGAPRAWLRVRRRELQA